MQSMGDKLFGDLVYAVFLQQLWKVLIKPTTVNEMSAKVLQANLSKLYGLAVTGEADCLPIDK